MSDRPTPDTPATPLEPPVALALYRQMVRLRQFELAAQRLYKAGRMPGFIHLYVGEEAVAAGVCAHLRPDDWITSTHRGHGHVLAKGVPARALLAEMYGKATGCCGGRGGSMHLYAPGAGLLGTNGIVAGGLPSAVGAALSAKVRGTDQVVVAFFGDGAVSHGAFHEAVNLAAIQNVPAIFVCENNRYATATPFNMATRNTDVAARAAAYGLPGVAVDGNDVAAVWKTMREAVARARRDGGPTLIEAQTYRTVGHHEGDPLVGVYRTQEELDEWKGRCPIRLWGDRLKAAGVATEANLEEIERAVAQEIQDAVDFAEASPQPDPATVLDHGWAEPLNPVEALAPPPKATAPPVETNWLEAVRDGVAEEMRHDPHLIYLGEGIGERGGSFAHTKGLWAEFGPVRVIDTPISELGFTGAAAGSSATGARAVADLMFIDFLLDAASQVILQAAKLRYMSRGQVQVPMVIRAAIGAVEKGAGPHHSGVYYPLWAHCPGLIVVAPSNPADAKALMKTALRASDPVLFLEHKALFGLKGPVPPGERYLPFGQAAVVREGSDLTLVSCGEFLHRTLAAATALEQGGLHCEVIDLRTIVPLDVETVISSVAKTGRLLIVDEGYAMCGVGAELSAAVTEQAFDELDAPIGRLHPGPVAHPFTPVLQNAMLVSVEQIVAAARATVTGQPPIPRRASGGARPATRPAAEAKPGSPPVAAAEPPPGPASADGVPIFLPNQDLTVTEATIVQWLKAVGAQVEAGEEILEAETAKSVFRVESPAAGVLVSVLAQPGEVVSLPANRPLGVIQPQAN